MYILEGNIGVGKTTFLTLLKKHCPNIDILNEPVANWSQEQHGQSLLADFYQDTSRWAYTLETFTMICRVHDHLREQNHKNPKRILERSIYSGHYCFARNSFESGNLNPTEWAIYKKLADLLIHMQCKPPLGFIYLKANPEVCFQRVQKRNRSSEKDLTLEYIKKIDHWHDTLLIAKLGLTKTLKSVPVLILDCNEDFVENHANMAKHAEKVTAFLHPKHPPISRPQTKTSNL